MRAAAEIGGCADGCCGRRRRFVVGLRKAIFVVAATPGRRPSAEWYASATRVFMDGLKPVPFKDERARHDEIVPLRGVRRWWRFVVVLHPPHDDRAVMNGVHGHSGYGMTEVG